MRIRTFFTALPVAGLVLALAVFATPAAAQTGGVLGTVVDEEGKPVAGADILISNPEGVGTVKLTTNAKGEYFAIGVRPLDYQIKATKGELTGRIARIHIGMGPATQMPTITVNRSGAASPATAEEAAEGAKKQAELQAAFKTAQTAIEAGRYDEAVAVFTKLATDVPKCNVCYLQIGRAQLQKKDEAAAEAAFKQALEIDPAKPEPYAELATLYNAQKKFDDATKMGAKANELMTASGNVDPVALYNQGVILWNQNKMAEALVLFDKAVAANPKMADAQYFLAMAQLNQGKMPEAKKAFEAYLALAPTGSHADEVKAMLPLLK